MKKKEEKKWTHFHDMNSGGGKKLDWGHIFIEAPSAEAEIVFFNRFGRNPNRVTCTCCGPDYSIDEDESLEQATGFERGCRYAYFKNGKEISEKKGFIIGKGTPKGVWSGYVEEKSETLSFHEYQTIGAFKKRKDVKIIRAKDIKKLEKFGELPEQGYVWAD